MQKSISNQISVFAHLNESNKWVDKDLSRFYDTSVGCQIAQHRSQCVVTGISPIQFSACFEYIYTCSRLFMFTLSSHILLSLGRHRCYLSHTFLSHPVLASLWLWVVSFLPAHPHSLILMYICLCQLDHVPFSGMRKSVSNQISVFAHPNESNKVEGT